VPASWVVLALERVLEREVLARERALMLAAVWAEELGREWAAQ